MSLRRALLLGVAALVAASAILAVAILLFGDFGETEGRVLGTAAALAAHGALVVPATVLLDRDAARPLALALAAVAVAGAATWVWVIWVGPGGDAPWRTASTTATLLVALSQVAATTARRRPSDPRAVRVLLPASIALVAVVAAIVLMLVWGGGEDAEWLGRVLAAAAVADVGAVALQPLLARAASAPSSVRLRLMLADGAVAERIERAPDTAAAVAAAIRAAEGAGGRVVRVDVLPPGPAPTAPSGGAP